MKRIVLAALLAATAPLAHAACRDEASVVSYWTAAGARYVLITDPSELDLAYRVMSRMSATPIRPGMDRLYITWFGDVAEFNPVYGAGMCSSMVGMSRAADRLMNAIRPQKPEMKEIPGRDA